MSEHEFSDFIITEPFIVLSALKIKYAIII